MSFTLGIFQQRLKDLRKENHYTLKEVSKHIGVSLYGYRKWEVAQTFVDFKDLCILADLYQVSIDYLLGRTDIRKHNATETFVNQSNVKKGVMHLEQTVVRKIDELGRIPIPKVLLAQVGLFIGCEVTITRVNDKIVIKRAYPTCIVCQSRHDLVTVKDDNICRTCLTAFIQKAG